MILDLKPDNLILGGGTALNCPANSRILNAGIFDDVFVSPAVDDSGLAIGASYYTYYHILKNKRLITNNNKYVYNIEYTGKELNINASMIKEVFNKYKISQDYEYTKIVDVLSEGGLCALFTGRSESGPRALCHRSILADPRDYKNWANVNVVKKREKWRPFAPVVLKENYSDYFSGAAEQSKFMLFNSNVINNQIPAVTHVDFTARVQTVEKDESEIFQILSNFKKKTGCSVLMNTSLNGPGEPIVENLNDLKNFFDKSSIQFIHACGFFIEK
jgi:carbamoyltransferase